ncbi:aldose epimerase family protein [Clostridium beijerinckii]|uniref:Aldose 1-epimerase n=1 Tax=Clostridium beijerinckii TaxID=1520 RepID=A0AAW3W3J9_CLOBE|nr:aldose epimerase family protein [Clostridium beijerinckii]MBC2456950.1 galactose mutarotase [Clostridium beijerinckii]MBC2473486.1 galactose mutarotase [Clostridium beijerinckii]NOV61992.1 aldose 1-epimerase [Clostridium beijerinckii]NOV68512.1 aldose 1-epimerase [Clostridium beijerinckii]NOW30043.1 aldose 1-epimerase [Clostridium beijerinckii]
MAIEKRLFGTIPNEKEVYIYTLKNSNGMKVEISNYGGTIVSSLIPNKNDEFIDVILGYDTLENYLKGDKFFGALIGRFGNRIQYGKFSLNGKEYHLAQNDGENHLHGGIKGFDKVVWDSKIIEDLPNALELSYYSKDGEEGYPGNLDVKVTYILTEDNSIEINYNATTDKDTIVNLTNHAYFNLSGHSSGDVLNQKLMINADKFTVNDQYSIPTGEIKEVDDTPMDFRKLTPIGKNINSDYNQIVFGKGFDHNWVLNANGSLELKAAQAVDENSGIVMDVYTTTPGIQFYSGNFLDGSDIGKNNAVYNRRNGFCLETQYFPNSINCSNFKSPILKAGEIYEHKTIYKFSTL